MEDADAGTGTTPDDPAGDAEAATDGTADPRRPDPESDAEDDHLAELADGCGCAEVWEHLSEHRQNRTPADAPDAADAEE